jgi:hypothetical protein
MHIVDTGYLDAELLVTSKQGYSVTLLGPTRANYRWQAREATGFEACKFDNDWERKQATCPAGYVSIRWKPAVDRNQNRVIHIAFSRSDCQPYASRAKCTRGASRTICVRLQPHHEALQAAREREKTAE